MSQMEEIETYPRLTSWAAFCGRYVAGVWWGVGRASPLRQFPKGPTSRKGREKWGTRGRIETRGAHPSKIAGGGAARQAKSRAWAARQPGGVSAVPTGRVVSFGAWFPALETPGYCRVSLRDSVPSLPNLGGVAHPFTWGQEGQKPHPFDFAQGRLYLAKKRRDKDGDPPCWWCQARSRAWAIRQPRGVSAVPTGRVVSFGAWFPALETPGYCRVSLRDSVPFSPAYPRLTPLRLRSG